MDTLGMPWPATDTATLTTSDWGLNNTHNSRQVGSKNTKNTWGRASDWCPTPKNKRHRFDLRGTKKFAALEREQASKRARWDHANMRKTQQKINKRVKFPKYFRCRRHHKIESSARQLMYPRRRWTTTSESKWSTARAFTQRLSDHRSK